MGSIIPFVNSSSLESGAINQVASKLTELTQAQSKINDIMYQVDNVLGNMNTAIPPGLPNMNDLGVALGGVESKVNESLSELDEVTGLVGSCLDGAMSSVYDIAKSGYGLVGEAMNSLYKLDGMPSELFDVFDYFNQARAMIDKLGLEKLIADINSSLGCLSSSSMIANGMGQISSVTSSLGLNPDGTVPNTYYDQLKTKMTALGFDNSYAQTMTDQVNMISSESKRLMINAEVYATEKISSIKKDIVAQTNAAEKAASSYF